MICPWLYIDRTLIGSGAARLLRLQNKNTCGQANRSDAMPLPPMGHAEPDPPVTPSREHCAHLLLANRQCAQSKRKT
jgi:hypothetical protein